MLCEICTREPADRKKCYHGKKKHKKVGGCKRICPHGVRVCKDDEKTEKED
jgi:hypothetical protein